MWFRRKESLHEKLAREGGLRPTPGGPLDPRPPLEVGIHGLSRPRQWDAVVSAEARLPGDEVHFAALPDGTLVVDEDVPDDALTPLAEALEAALEPPYRAEGVKHGDDVWAVAANRIEVVELAEEPGGDEIELAVQGDHRTLLVDGQRVFGGVPTLEALARLRHESYVVRAVRLDGRLWEVRIAPL
jgi:hypothetical protein